MPKKNATEHIYERLFRRSVFSISKFVSTRAYIPVSFRKKLREIARLLKLPLEKKGNFDILGGHTNEELRKHKDNFFKKDIICRVQTTQHLIGSYSEIHTTAQFTKEQNDPFYLRIGAITTNQGWGYGYENEPLTVTAEELIKWPALPFDQTTLYWYFKTFQPQRLSESLFINDSAELDSLSPYQYFRPWVHSQPTVRTGGLFGPKDKSVVQMRVIRLRNLIELLSEYSYVPTMNDIIMGYILTHGNDFRFVLTAGEHRVAVLSALNRQGLIQNNQLLVKIDKTHTGKAGGERHNQSWLFDRGDSKQWPAVVSGFISEKGALKLFDSFFCDRELELSLHNEGSM